MSSEEVIRMSKSLMVHSAVAGWELTYTSVPTSTDGQTLNAGGVSGSCIYQRDRKSVV